jgi:hypothetical protein
MLGSITGQPLAGWIFDSYGSYQTAWFTFAGVTAMGALSFLFIPSVRNKMAGVDKS